MTIDMRCSVCRNADRRRAIELCWNGGMKALAISHLFEGITSTSITKHLKDHAEGDFKARDVEVERVRPARERVLAIQQLQLDEFERQVALAKQKADMLNAVLDDLEAAGAEGAAETPRHDWSEFFNILSKDGQAAISSILKVTALEDRKAAKTADLKLGLFDAMARAGLAPKGISGVKSPLALPSGTDDDEDDPSA